MTKKISLLFSFVFLIFSNQALAHTTLSDSTPRDGEVVTQPLQELTLFFETKVEETSKIDVTNSDGESIKLENFVIEDEVMWATFLEPLKNGTYDVNWSIIGADGHPIEGTFSFSVDVPTEGKIDTDSIETKDVEPKQVEGNQESPLNSQQEIEGKQSNIPSYVIPTITGVLFVIIIGSVFWLMRRGK